MALYTYYCRRAANGAALAFEAHELASDEAAHAHAVGVLADHPSCDLVEVFLDDRRVGEVRRET